MAKNKKGITKNAGKWKRYFLAFIVLMIVLIMIFGSRCDMRKPVVDEVLNEKSSDEIFVPETAEQVDIVDEQTEELPEE